MRPQPLLAGSFLIAATFLLGWWIPAKPAAPRQESQPVTARPAPPPSQAVQRISFEAQVRPILEARCQPCHFAGGKLYSRLPFDRPETVSLLGDKLFTRIRDQREQALLRAFLAQAAEPKSR